MNAAKFEADIVTIFFVFHLGNTFIKNRMRTMYIAANNCLERGYFLGDVLVIIKCAWTFVQNEPHEHVVLSLLNRDPLNFLWNKFIAENQATVIYEDWPRGNRDFHYATLDRRRAERSVRGMPFHCYKELYARLDGGARQHALCGSEKGLKMSNIFEYFYVGQETTAHQPARLTDFSADVIDQPVKCATVEGRSVFLAPHEKAHGNKVFTLEFWRQVVLGLIDAHVAVTVNDRDSFMNDFKSPLFRKSFLPFDQLIAQLAGQKLVVCGNTGVGWAAAAINAPMIAMEKPLAWGEYSFTRCGCAALKRVISEPDPGQAVHTILNELGAS